MKLKTIGVAGAVWALSIAAWAGTPYYFHNSVATGVFKLMDTNAPLGAGVNVNTTNCPDLEVADFASPVNPAGLAIPAGTWTFNLYSHVATGTADFQVQVWDINNFGSLTNFYFTSNSPAGLAGPPSTLLSWSLARPAYNIPAGYRLALLIYMRGTSCPGAYFEQLDFDDLSFNSNMNVPIVPPTATPTMTPTFSESPTNTSTPAPTQCFVEDSSFSSGLVLRNDDVGVGLDWFRKIAIDSLGRIVVVGQSAGAGTVWRFQNNGNLDSTFAGTGYYAIPGFTNAYGVAIGPGDSIYVGGEGKIAADDRIKLAKITTSGSLDASFGVGGVATNQAVQQDHATSLALNSLGQIILTGYGTTSPATSQYMIVQLYDSSGSLINQDTFTSSGSAKGLEIELDASNNIFIAGIRRAPSLEDYPCIWKYNSSLVRQTSGFGISGIAEDPILPSGNASSISRDSLGRFWISGVVTGGALLARFNVSGTLDTTFNGSGFEILNIPGGGITGAGYRVLPDNFGRIVVAGFVQMLPKFKEVIWRVNDDGSLDLALNGTGYVVREDLAGGNTTRADDAIFDSSNRLLVAGVASNPIDASAFLQRWTDSCPAPSQTPTYTISPSVTSSISPSPSDSPSSSVTPSVTPSISPTSTPSVSPTPTPCACPGVFGTSSVGPSSQPFAGFIHTNRYALPAGANHTLKDIVVNVRVAGGGQIRAAIYQGAGMNHAFIVQSAPQIAALGWNTLDIPDTMVPGGGDILIALMTEPGVEIAFALGASGLQHQISQSSYPFGNFPSPIISTDFGGNPNFYSAYVNSCPDICPTSTPSATPTLLLTSSATPTLVSSPSASPTLVSTDSATATLVSSASATATLISTNSATPTSTPTNSATLSPSFTQSSTTTYSHSPTLSSTNSATRTFSASPTFSHSPTISPSFTVSPTPTNTTCVYPDYSFGNAGQVVRHNDAGGNQHDEAYGVAVDSQGRIVVAGSSVAPGLLKKMTVWRFLSNGQLDPAFGSGGVFIDTFYAQSQAKSLKIGAGDAIYVGGDCTPSQTMAAWKLNSSGVLDAGFGGAGRVSRTAVMTDYGYGIAVDNTGRVILTGQGYDVSLNRFMILQVYSSTGAYVGGVSSTVNNDSAGRAVQVDGADNIYVGGHFKDFSNRWHACVWKYNSALVLQTGSFGVSGVAYLTAVLANNGGYGLNIDSSGRLLLTGWLNAGSDTMLISRFTGAGAVDTTFNGSGYNSHVGAGGATGNDYGFSVVSASDGRVYVGGSSMGPASDPREALWRYTDLGALDTSFNGLGYKAVNSVAGGSSYDGANSLALDGLGRLLVAGISAGSANDAFVQAWYDTCAVPSPTATPTLSFSVTSSISPTPSDTPLVSGTYSPTESTTATATATLTATASASPTALDTFTASTTPTTADSATPTPVYSATETPTLADSPSPSATASMSPTLTASPSESASASASPTPAGPYFTVSPLAPPGSWCVGNTFTVIIQVTNSGGVNLESISPSVTTQGSASGFINGGPNPPVIASLAVGASDAFTYTFQGSSPGTLAFKSGPWGFTSGGVMVQPPDVVGNYVDILVCTPSPSSTPSATATPTLAYSPTETPTLFESPTSSETAQASPSATPTLLSSDTASPTLVSSDTSSPTPVSSPTATVTPGILQIIQDFEDGTTMNWHEGGPSPNPPVNVANGGPLGAGDNYISNVSAGGAGAGSRLVQINNVDWSGNLISAGVGGFEADFINEGATTIYLRLVVGSGSTRYASNVAFTLAVGSGWQHVTFDLNDMTLVSGSGSLASVLGNVTELRVLSAQSGPTYLGDAIVASLGMDNFRAMGPLPTPTPTATFSDSPSPSASATAADSATPTALASNTASPTLSATPSSSPANTTTATGTPTVTPSHTPTSLPGPASATPTWGPQPTSAGNSSPGIRRAFGLPSIWRQGKNQLVVDLLGNADEIEVRVYSPGYSLIWRGVNAGPYGPGPNLLSIDAAAWARGAKFLRVIARSQGQSYEALAKVFILP